MAHDMVFALKATAERFTRLGVLRADRQLALEVLRDWRRDIVVMPGGDVETWRPWRDRYKLRWGNRKGYARIAAAAGVPIVPIACAGAHSTLMVLSDGRRFARTIRLHELFRSEIFPVHLSMPFGLTVGPFPHIPPPAHFRYLIGDPIMPPPPTGDGDPDPDVVADVDRQVRARMQGLLDALAGGALKG